MEGIPEREDEDAFALSVAEFVRRTIISAAVARGIDILATNSDGSQERRDFLLGLLGAGATERIEDPGIETVRQRLAVNGVVSPQCERAIGRWYLNVREQRTVEVRATATELIATILQEGTPASGGLSEVFTNGSVEWGDGVDILTVHHGKPEARAIPQRQPDGRITITAALTDGLRQAWNDGKRFMSVEFFSLRERTTKGGVRSLERALVTGAALVKVPEYDAAVAEVRSETPKRRRRRYYV